MTILSILAIHATEPLQVIVVRVAVMILSWKCHVVTENRSCSSCLSPAAELWEAAVRGESGQENWRGEAIDGRTINISESASEPWQIPLKGELTVFFTSYPKTPAVDSVLAKNHLYDLSRMIQVISAFALIGSICM